MLVCPCWLLVVLATDIAKGEEARASGKPVLEATSEELPSAIQRTQVRSWCCSWQGHLAVSRVCRPGTALLVSPFCGLEAAGSESGFPPV